MISSEHYQKYSELCKRFHVSWKVTSPKLVHESLETLTQKYYQDEHLNNVSLFKWDNLAIVFLANNRSSGLSLAEVVCMQKHAAVELILSSRNILRPIIEREVKYALPTFVSKS